MERQNRFGVYFILKSMEVGPSFPITLPQYPTAGPNYRIMAWQRSRYGHYYIRDERQKTGAPRQFTRPS